MKQNNNHIYKAEQLNWERLEEIGISRSQIEKDGNLDLLLQGKETEVITLKLKTMVFSLSMDATLRLQEENDGKAVFCINGINSSNK